MTEISRDGERVTVKVGQDVVASMARDFKQELSSLVQGGAKELVIDLAGAEMIDSIGLGVILATYNSLHRSGGKLAVTNAREGVYTLFKTMRLDQHFAVSAI